MAAARKTTNTRSTSTATTKAAADKAAEDKATEDAKAVDGKTEASVEDKSTARPAEAELVENPELKGGVDQVSDARQEAEDREDNQEAGAFLKDAEEKRKEFVNEGHPTSEAWDDPHVNLADVPANFDPVVSASHAQASRAATVDEGKLRAAAPVQISQFDTSDYGRSVLNSVSHTVEPKDKDEDSDK